MSIACWIPKATRTYSEYVILIALLLQQWLNESAWMLRSRYTAHLVQMHNMRTAFLRHAKEYFKQTNKQISANTVRVWAMKGSS